MKGAYALLDIVSVMEEQEQRSDQYIKNCQWKMHYRGIEPTYIAARRSRKIEKWLEDNKITPYQCWFQEDSVGLLSFLLKRYPSNWELNLIADHLKLIEADRNMGREERKNRGIEVLGYIEKTKVLYFNHNEAKRKAASDHYCYETGVQVCATMEEAASAMDIPPEARNSDALQRG